MTTPPVCSSFSALFGIEWSVVGKELRLKQQYFWTAASLSDILRRFKNLGKTINELPDCASPFPCPFVSQLII